ncbi:MAG: Ig-like domain-containing protein [Gemmatimonadaceae bacterium]
MQLIAERAIDITLRYESTVATDAAVRVTSSDPSVVRLDTTVKAAHGSARFTYRGIVPGTASLSAFVGAMSAQLNVTVLRQGIAGVQIEPTFASLAVDDTVPLLAAAIGMSGDVVPGVPIGWTSSDPTVAAVSPLGVVTGTGIGDATITARETESGKASHISAHVVLPRLASIEIAPSPGEVPLGSVVGFSATGVDRKGRRYPALHATWSVDDTSRLALVRPDTGFVLGRGLGQTTLRATANQGVGSLPVTVLPNPVTHITFDFGARSGWDGDSLHMWTDDFAQSFAQPLGASGNTLQDRPVAWMSSDPTVATISSAGVIHANAPGNFSITATIDGFSASAPGRVRLTPPVVSVKTGSAFFTRVVGQALRLRATVLGLGDSVMADRPLTWSSSAPLVARITDDGVMTAISPGTAQITASSGGKTSDPLVLTVAGDAASSQWNPQVRFDGPTDARVEESVRRAIVRLQQVIRGDVPDVPLDLPKDACYSGSPSLTQTVDDIIVLVRFVPFPSLLGAAGTCVVRTQGSLPVVGEIFVDSVLARTASEADLDNAMLHNLLHAAGMSFPVWNGLSLWTGPVTDPAFNGPTAQAAFRAAGGVRYPSRVVPVAEGDANLDSYIEWRTSIMRPEMFSTDAFDPDVLHPLSAVTIGALGDIGYQVATTAADDFHLGPQVPLLPRVGSLRNVMDHARNARRRDFTWTREAG